MQYSPSISTRINGNDRLIYTVEGRIKPPKVKLDRWYRMLAEHNQLLNTTWRGDITSVSTEVADVSFGTFDEMVLYFLHVLHAKP